MKNSRLGKGLDALIGSSSESVDKTTGITTVKVADISPNKFQPRIEFDQEKLEELANSLRESGIIQPIIVTKKDNSKYELIAGERRLEASKIAGFTEIPVIIRSVSPKEQLQFAIIENVQRENLSAIEEAKAYQKLSEDFGLTHGQIAKMVAKDRATVTNLIRLLKLNGNIQKLILKKKLSTGHARTILQVEEHLRQDFADTILKHKMSVRKAEETAKKMKNRDFSKKATAPQSQQFNKFETELADIFQTKIKIIGKENFGKITIHYKSFEKLQQIIEKLKK
ncbi:MAG: ParB/RepB/Spo0J family partition protein [Candidatus Cloacimonetes bacterium]|jgi:ParB family transcriptional regulator, chromosome partitioning protein|nr:ParB/RepB/Spo0J family partition protein [Candidatus Cloacimonadota bacterium]MBT6994867.1 ParB/RepB/Spo0J family partition protein [Candidatus Cloacimonadota bacterium]MBT7468802.1 ParB/RepB/Spo0J family partition protein [Candidatus Cloacimonadota bacterium]